MENRYDKAENVYELFNKLTLDQLVDLREQALGAGLYDCDSYQVLEMVITSKKRAQIDEKFLQLLSKVV